MRRNTHQLLIIVALYFALEGGPASGAEAALPADVQPAVQADFSADGLLTWWLVSPQIETPADAKPPTNAREGAPVFSENQAAWSLHLPDTFYNDFRRSVTGGKGSVFAATRIMSSTGGARIFYVRTYCAVKIFLNGTLIVSKPQPEGITVFKVPLNFPPGASEVIVELSPRAENCLMQCLLHDGRGNAPPAKPVAGDSIFLPTAKGKMVDVNAVAVQCLSVAAKNPIIIPGGKTTLFAGIQGSMPRAASGITARLINGTDVPPGAESPVAVDTLFQTEFTAPIEPACVYEARLEFRANGKSIGIKSVSLICLQGFAVESQRQKTELKAREEKAGRILANAHLAIEKLDLFLAGIAGKTIDPDVETGREMLALTESARQFMELESVGRDPFEGKSGYLERAYVSAIDNGVQPYIVSAPDAAVAKNAEAFPLVVFLHGYDPNMNKHRWWEAKDYAAVCARNKCFLAIPFGRMNTDFQSCGEVDVLDVIKEMKAHYRIDPNRIYLCGISMGGMGVYSLAAHYPDEFAAAMVLAGRADSPLQNNTALANFQPFKQWLIETDNPISLCENLINLPLRIYHGEDDNVVPATQARRMLAGLQKAGCAAKLILVPGGHRSGFDILKEEEPLKWLLSNSRNAMSAKRKMKAYSLAFAKQGGVEVTAISDATMPIELEWSEVEGKPAFQKESAVILQKKIHGVLSPPEIAGVLLKTQNVCGPVRQAFCGPFTIVYGTRGTDEANAFNKKNALRFAQEWLAFTRSEASIKSDLEVTPDEKQQHNLFLFGEEQDNALHAELAKDLPISVKGGNAVIDGKTVPLAGKGILYIYPSTFSNRKRMVIICAGIPYGEKIGVNHKLDLVPDILLYDGTFDTDGTSTNKAVCAGFFNGQWKFDSNTMWWFDK